MKSTNKLIFVGVLVVLATIIASCASSLHIKELDWNNKEVSKCEEVMEDVVAEHVE